MLASMRFIFMFSILLLPVAANGQGTAAQKLACTGDAFKFCGPQIPDVPAVTACMRTNYASLSAKCQAQFDRPGKSKR